MVCASSSSLHGSKASAQESPMTDDERRRRLEYLRQWSGGLSVPAPPKAARAPSQNTEAAEAAFFEPESLEEVAPFMEVVTEAGADEGPFAVEDAAGTDAAAAAAPFMMAPAVAFSLPVVQLRRGANAGDVATLGAALGAAHPLHAASAASVAVVIDLSEVRSGDRRGGIACQAVLRWQTRARGHGICSACLFALTLFASLLHITPQVGLDVHSTDAVASLRDILAALREVRALLATPPAFACALTARPCRRYGVVSHG